MLVTQPLINHGSIKLDNYKIPRLKPYEEPGITYTGYLFLRK